MMGPNVGDIFGKILPGTPEWTELGIQMLVSALREKNLDEEADKIEFYAGRTFSNKHDFNQFPEPTLSFEELYKHE